MKKAYKRILLAIGAIVVVLALLSIGYLIKARSIMKGMTPVETKQIIENVYAIRDSFANFYLIRDGEHYIAIDAGNKPGNIQKELKKLYIKPGEIEAVLLTHTDGDHVAGIRLFKNAEVYLSKPEEKMINGEESRFFIFGNKIDTEKYKIIEDQQIINIGNIKIKGFLTPGHTTGSMCYLVNDKFLFTGDALRLTKGKVEPFVGFFNRDTEKAEQSISIITRIPEAQFIFTAHYGYSDDYRNAVKEWK